MKKPPRVRIYGCLDNTIVAHRGGFVYALRFRQEMPQKSGKKHRCYDEKRHFPGTKKSARYYLSIKKKKERTSCYGSWCALYGVLASGRMPCLPDICPDEHLISGDTFAALARAQVRAGAAQRALWGAQRVRAHSAHEKPNLRC